MMRQGWGMVLLGVLTLPSLAMADDTEVAELQSRLQAQQVENERLRQEHEDLEARIERLQRRIERYRGELESDDMETSGDSDAP